MNGNRMKIGDNYCDIYDFNIVEERSVQRLQIKHASIPGKKYTRVWCNIPWQQLPHTTDWLNGSVVLFIDGYLMRGYIAEFKFCNDNNGEKFASIITSIIERIPMFSNDSV